MLRLGPIEVPVPVILAPMAQITNPAYRQLCREQAELGAPGTTPAGLFVCEMITSRGVVEGNQKTFDMLRFDPGDPIKSVQLYGVDPTVIAKAISILAGDLGVTHIDLNFGCPVPKVTRKGGGGVLPWKRDRLRAILTHAVAAAAPYQVPVTMKTRKGIDDDHLTYLDAGRIAEDSGVAAIGLHGRTVVQAYGGTADWEAIAALRDHVSIPVLGNGDIWEASDAQRMLDETGCAGVIVGRGCLGRPWLFRDLAAALGPQSATHQPTLPTLGEVATMVRRHGELLAELHTEKFGLTDLRKHMAWYFKGFGIGSTARQRLGTVSSFAELDDIFAGFDSDEPFPVAELGAPRGRQGTPRERVTVPSGWLDSQSLDDDTDLSDAESDVSGG